MWRKYYYTVMSSKLYRASSTYLSLLLPFLKLVLREVSSSFCYGEARLWADQLYLWNWEYLCFSSES